MDSHPRPPGLAEPGTPALPLYAVAPVDLPGLAPRIGPDAQSFLEASGFAAKPQECRLLPGPGGISGAVIGLGNAAPTPWSFGALPQALPPGTTWRLADPSHAEQAVLGWVLGAYAYTRFKPAARIPARLLQPDGTAAALNAAESISLARDLINAPANVLGPAELAAAAQAVAQRHGARFTEVTGVALAAGFPALAAVGRASSREPRLAQLEWNQDAKASDGTPLPLVALCGKGVCFDTGGLDLKPSAAMLRMKKDMGGAAVVLGVADLIMRQNLPVRLLVLIGAVENALGGDAMRPLDVLTTRVGLTVEVGNTDAEGRLVLADLLTYAAEFGPHLMVDCATLTGAARVALGPDLPAMFASDDALAATVIAAGKACHDPVWQLPLHDGYEAWIESSVADINNVATRPMAGAIIGGLFLRRFVPAAIPWLHLDLYGWNDAARPGRPEGGEAQGLRAVVGAIETLFAGRAGSCR